MFLKQIFKKNLFRVHYLQTYTLLIPLNNQLESVVKRCTNLASVQNLILTTSQHFIWNYGKTYEKLAKILQGSMFLTLAIFRKLIALSIRTQALKCIK